MDWVDTVIHVKHAMSDYAQRANPTYGLPTTQMAWGGWIVSSLSDLGVR
jgi:hypothetical protein